MKIILSIDVEAHRSRQEISGGPVDGLGRILEALAQHSVPATFFVDLCEARTWGIDYMEAVSKAILKYKQDIQLHAHPHHYSGDSNRWLLHEYSCSEQKELLEYAVGNFTRFVGRKPRAFRAGGFGANDDTFDLLRTHGIVIDSSYLYRHPHCHFIPPASTSPSMYRSVLEIPLTPVVTLGTARYPLRVAALDFNWLPLTVMQNVLLTLRDSGSPYAIVLMHSSSLFQRSSRSGFTYKAENLQKLNVLLEFLQERKFQLTVFQDIPAEEAPTPPGRFSPIIVSNPLRQYGILRYQARVGNRFSLPMKLFRWAHSFGLIAALLLGCWAIARMVRLHP